MKTKTNNQLTFQMMMGDNGDNAYIRVTFGNEFPACLYYDRNTIKRILEAVRAKKVRVIS